MKVAIRMDDISPNMDWGKFKRVTEMLESKGIYPLLGVVPDNLDDNLNRDLNSDSREDNFWEYLKELQKKGYVMALHGYHHRYTSDKGGMFPLNHFSEFVGYSLEEQTAMLHAAQKILAGNGITANIFMAPAHAYDKNTLKALKSLGITNITDGFGKRPYRYMGMTFYPIAFRLANDLKKEGYTTMVLHANTMEEKDFLKLKDVLDQHYCISYGRYMEEIARSRGPIGRLVEYIMASVKHFLVYKVLK